MRTEVVFAAAFLHIYLQFLAGKLQEKVCKSIKLPCGCVLNWKRKRATFPFGKTSMDIFHICILVVSNMNARKVQLVGRYLLGTNTASRILLLQGRYL